MRQKPKYVIIWSNTSMFFCVYPSMRRIYSYKVEVTFSSKQLNVELDIDDDLN